jgi:lipopolysaccharide export system protein LptA
VKKACFIALLILANVWIVRAQTNAPNTNAAAEILALVTTNAPAIRPTTNAPTQIDSDSADFDLNGRRAIYSGHVRVDDSRMTLICAQLTVDLPTTGGRINHIVAETNVVIDATDDKGATNHITCGKAVYDYNVQGMVTNETVTLTSSPQIVNAQGTNIADKIIYYPSNKHIRWVNPRMFPNLSGANTNDLPVPKSLF